MTKLLEELKVNINVEFLEGELPELVNKIKADAYRSVGEILKYNYGGLYDRSSIESYFDDLADELEGITYE